MIPMPPPRLASTGDATKTVAAWLHAATAHLKIVGIASAKLDAELIACDVLGVDRTWLLTHSLVPLGDDQLTALAGLLARRSDREPLAYLRGFKEFYGRRFIVNRSVLVPRPESEALIELLRSLHPLPHHNLIDVGTGSGALGVTAALEFPELHVTLSDVSTEALEVAQKNAHELKASVTCIRRDLLGDSPASAASSAYFHYIVANLPYVDPGWERSPETDFEPSLALYSHDGGLALIKKIIVQAPRHLAAHGYVLLEADPRQHTAIIDFAEQYRLKHVRTDGFAMALQA